MIKDWFDPRFICSTCNGEGEVRHVGTKKMIKCRKCKGSGFWADGYGLRTLAQEQEKEQAKLKERPDEVYKHITKLKEVIHVRFTEVGAELTTPTGTFLFVQASDQLLAAAVRPRDEPKVKEWEITHETMESEDDDD